MGAKIKEVSTPPLPHSKKLKWLTTIAIFFGNVTFGCAFTFIGPSLEDLRGKFESTVDSISVVFTVSMIGYCIGALTSGVIYNFMRQQIGVIICLAGMALALYTIPHVKSQTVFFVIGGLLGYFAGAYDATQIVWIIEIWQDEAGPFIQTQHFCYALGSNVAPLVLAPFLSSDNDEDVLSTTIGTTSALGGRNSNMTLFAEEDEIPSSYSSTIWIPYTIGGAFSTSAVLFQLFLFIFYTYYTPPLYANDSSINDSAIQNNDDNADEEKKVVRASDGDLAVTRAEKGSFDSSKPETLKIQDEIGATEKEGMFTNINWAKMRLIFLAACFAGANQGMELCTFQFTSTFGQYSDLNLSESDAALALTGLTAAFTVARFFGIFLIFKVPAVPLLYIDLALVLIGNIILFVWANDNLTMFWVACILIGAGFGSMYPSYYAFMEKHLVFTNAIGAFMVVFASVVSAIYPVIVGQGIEEKAVTLTYPIFFSLAVGTTSLTTSLWLTYKDGRRHA